MKTRFAPSPTGPLHLGHAWSAWMAHDMARAAGGAFLLRIEDIDRQRSKLEWEDQLKRDLEWLGIEWDAPPMRQSERMESYRAALGDLWRRGLLYPCTCTRRDIAAAISAPQEGAGPDGPIYPGTCRHRRPDHAERQMAPPEDAHLRLLMREALIGTTETLRNGHGGLPFHEFGGVMGSGTIWTSEADMEAKVGDVVLARKDFGTSYHLSVVLDDAAQGITHVVRGADLFEATPIHVLLQRLLGLPTPDYHHHALVRDAAGKRLAKRDDARAISVYREAGWTPEALRARLQESLIAPEP
ncbi:tRNA glutamyl-Q(34) synthetase GluQRS [Jannaschia seohaensis]|uniref:Glutamyl-Q tRNA(Asp) synthetase n=1 Tax=Jannaschia seohaensis TaxID=475081 RepID=A0A2Y9AK60_9RHOB|nr:tRNA glutamyl-Q(34) synthetase GluQRS [Jannaschia seohaensis]PWJ20368.1 glutamyl-Q tRNA(Asp) synthetase [Jannaschia seohaensis]SSA44426.1 glutamyl-Q tRNA(Asp) synthetase [Jannaschia seohaensis]